ncbi:hypothetical protein D9M69_582170 [compost metagenome]
MVATGADSSSKVMLDSGFGLAGFSETGAALLVKPDSRTNSMALEVVRPQLSRSRTVRRCCSGWTMPTRCGCTRSPAEPMLLVITAFTGTERLWLPPPEAWAANAVNRSSLVKTSPMVSGRPLPPSPPSSLTISCSAACRRACSSPWVTSSLSTLALVSSDILA